MTQSSTAFTDKKSSSEAGEFLGSEITKGLGGKTPNVVILFASSEYDYSLLLSSINRSCSPEILVGCSSAGEFTSQNYNTNAISAVGIHSDEIKFSAGLSFGIKQSREKVVQELFSSLQGVGKYDYPYQSALILADALSGHTDQIIDLLTEKTLSYQFFGGGAGDNAKFEKTHVFFGEEAVTDAAIILEILSTKPVGIGVKHGWTSTGQKMRVTKSEGMKLSSLNGISALEMFLEHAKATNQKFDPNDPIPFFLHNLLGIETNQGFKLRVPLTVLEDGSIIFASDIPSGSILSFMSIELDAPKEAAMKATSMAIEKLNGSKPEVALFFDCVATRLRMGSDFEKELEQVKNTLGGINYAGCNTYGQIARVEGQFSGFHNCTAVVCVIPQ